jgi:MFS family permease
MATLAVFLIDRLGRRQLLMIGAAGMTIAQAGQAALIKYSHVSKSVAGATLLFDFLALAFFPIGLFLIPFMYSAEIAPLRIRHKITAMSAATNWLFNFLIAEVTPIGFRTIGWRCESALQSIGSVLTDNRLSLLHVHKCFSFPFHLLLLS